LANGKSPDLSQLKGGIDCFRHLDQIQRMSILKNKKYELFLSLTLGVDISIIIHANWA
jgi:hypothetical protein